MRDQLAHLGAELILRATFALAQGAPPQVPQSWHPLQRVYTKKG